MIKKTLLLLAITLTGIAAMAQDTTRTITGIVYLKKDLPMPGAVITVPETTITTESDTYGAFCLGIPKGKNSLLITAVGYESKTIKVGKKKGRDITLKRIKNLESKHLWAERMTLTGIISGEGSKETFPGTVISINRKQVTSTGMHGEYKVTVYKGDFISFQFIGHKPQTVIIKERQTVLNLSLKEISQTKNEEIAIADY